MTTQKMQLVDWLDDLCVRFIINLPQEELESVARICFQVEEAQWFYEDFVRPIDPTLPSLNLKQFCLRIFRHCPLLSAFSDEQHLAAYQEFLGYKTRVPVRGAIMLNYEMDKVVLVKGWKNNASWSFPRGKINKDEPDLDCAVREVYEETGYDIHDAGLASDPDAVKAIDVTMREQHMRLFVFRGVPEDTAFEPKTRKEISKIQWYRLADLPTLKKKVAGQTDGHESHNPNKFYMVAPFLGPLKKWINQQKKIDAQRALYEEYAEGDDVPSEAFVEEQSTRDPAADLKRLLSVQPTQQPGGAYGQQQPDQQAQSLLTMLRGGQGMPQQAWPQQGVPHTPLEQIGGYPLQPQSPHAHHVRESPFATSQPPPIFSPPQPQPQQLQLSNRPEPTKELSANQQHLLRMMQQGLNPQGHQPQQQLPIRGAPQPQQSQSQTVQGLTGPAPSQGPRPTLNSHAMGLLSAFKSGPGAGQPSALLSAAKQAPLPNTPHQNSLLDLLRGPSGSAAVTGSTPTPAETHEPPATGHVDETSQGTRPPAMTSRRPSAMSMITRTLPRASRKPSAPSMDTDNFPVLGTAPPPVPKVEAKIASNIPPKPVTILARPEQSSTTSQPPSRPASRSKQSATPTPVTILQRPSSGQRASENASPASQTQGKPAFQPQILKRGETITSPEPPTAAPQETNPSQTQNQRSALLSLFSQTQQRTPESGTPDATARSSRNGSMASSPDGLKSPSEKRGFLMDYLDGVVRGAK